MKLFKSAKSYQPNAKFKTFMFRVATNHCLNEVRRADYAAEPAMAHEAEEGSAQVSMQAERPDQTLEGKQLEAAVGKALSAMSERERAAFSMCRFEGMAYKDIAQALAASEPAVKSLIHRATLTMMKELDAFQTPFKVIGSHA